MSEPSIREVPQSAGALNGFLTDLKKSICTIYKDVPTKEQLVKAGVIGLTNGGGIEGPGQVTRVVPPSPTGVVFSSAITNVLVSFDNPNYQGHVYSEMLRGDTNSYGNAIVVQRINGSVGAHPIGPARSGYYWIRHVSINFTGPPDSQTGTLVTTGQDVAPLLQILEGNIKETHLFSTLGTRINLIDGLASVPGSVNNRVAAETTARVNALIAEAAARGTAISNEATLRINGDTAEATQRDTLAAQMRGAYTGTDINSLSTGLLYQERIARASNDAALSQQITLLSAGAGEQFDYSKIWYFDSTVEGWTGNGTPTVSAGFLRPANITDPNVVSPTGLAIDVANYNQVRLRIRKVGAPVWDGFLFWRAAADVGFASPRSIFITQPTYDANGIGLATINLALNITLDQLRIDLSTDQTAAAYFEIDWVAVGRPSPGASSASLFDEQVARAAADLAEATDRRALSSKLTGLTDPSGATLPSLSAGLLFDERTARSTQDTALATSITNLQATVTTNEGTSASAVSTEATARANADTALATQVTTLAAKTEGGFDSGSAYYFDNNTEGWNSSGVTLSWLSGKMIATSTNNDPVLFSPVFPTPIEGGKYTKIRVAVKRLAGSGWDGSLFYATAAHEFTAGFYKTIPTPAVFSVGNSAVLEWDMSALKVGGSDWISNNILQIRVDLGNSASDVFEIDWVAIGRCAPGGSVAAIQQEAVTRATVDGHLSSQYSVRLELDSNGQSVAGGFGLSGTSSPTQGPRIDFGVRADRFYVSAPSGSTPLPSISPFVVQTTQQTIGGQLVPTGVYMDTAFIKNGTISSAKIANLAVDNAKIANLDAAKLTTGFLDAARINAQSLTADKIDTRGLTIKEPGGNIILASGTPLQSQYAAFGNSRNVIENGHYKDALVGTILGFSNTSLPALGRNLNSSYIVQGEGTAYIAVDGATVAGNVFTAQVRNGNKNFAVEAGKRYEFYAHLNTHRCTASFCVAWADINGAYISENLGSPVAYETGIASINDMPQSLGFATAPANAKSCFVFVRGITNGAASPFVFFSRAYFSPASVNQTEASPWSSGGGITQITASNASTYIADLAVDTLQIAGNAVTVSVGAKSVGKNYAGLTENTILTLPNIVTDVQPLAIFCGYEVVNFWPTGEPSAKHLLKIKVNGVEVDSYTRFSFESTPVAVSLKSKGVLMAFLQNPPTNSIVTVTNQRLQNPGTAVQSFMTCEFISLLAMLTKK